MSGCEAYNFLWADLWSERTTRNARARPITAKILAIMRMLSIFVSSFRSKGITNEPESHHGCKAPEYSGNTNLLFKSRNEITHDNSCKDNHSNILEDIGQQPPPSRVQTHVDQYGDANLPGQRGNMPGALEALALRSFDPSASSGLRTGGAQDGTGVNLMPEVCQ